MTTIYQWYHNNAPVGRSTNEAWVITNAQSLVITNVQPSDFGPYFVTVDTPYIGYPWYSKTSTVANITLAQSPSLTNFSVGSNSKFSFRTEAGPDYIVEYKANLTDPAWIQLSTNPGTGEIIQVTDPAVGIASRFYRVRLF
jgi:hypothetical protein